MPSTPKINTYITDSSGNRVYGLRWHPVIGTESDAIALRLYNGESSQGTSANIIFSIRADLLRSNPSWEESLESNANGSELVAESWVEIKVGAGAWTPIDEWASGGVDLGAIAAGAYASFQVRVNIPAGADTIGECNFALVVRSRP